MKQQQDGLRLARFDAFPDVLFDVEARDLWRHLPGPSLFHIAGRQPRPLFLSVLLHGNEDTGWRALQAVLRRYKGRELPRSLLVFVGNIAAAQAGVRTLDMQTDYNRVWPGTRCPETPEAALMREVADIAARHKPFASIDIHNNSGNNPHYGCVNDLAAPHLHLASLFSRIVVFFTRPLGVQSAAMAKLCPAVTLECGRQGVAAGTEHGARFIEAGLALTQFPAHCVAAADIDLLRTAAIIRVPADATISFDGSDADFMFDADLDRLNFSDLKAGTSFGKLGGNQDRRLKIVPGLEPGQSVETYFDYADGDIKLTRPAVPSMLTLDESAIRLDCLGYLMHRINRDGSRAKD